MIKLENRELSDRTLRALKGYQAEIDNKPSYAERVDEAKRIWPIRKQNNPFIEVKAKLTEMCPGVHRCCYCEDSSADEIEHIWPKNFYPDKTFVWENYLYACGRCNGPKGNQFALFKDETVTRTVLEHPQNGPLTEPPPGEPVFINPRKENPMDFLWLDIQNSFAFTTIEENLDSRDYCRAKYTIDVLKLNSRDDLIQIRSNAYVGYRARLSEYIIQRDRGATKEKLETLISGIQSEHHPTVWKEMQRQQGGIPELRKLFSQAPEALGW